MDVRELEEKVKELKRDALEAVYAAQSGHPGSALSTMEVLVALYYGGVLVHNPERPSDPGRDYFLLSNGHACPALYAVLADRGFFPKDNLATLRQLGSPVQGHPHRGALPGVEISSGSLGMGLSVGIGICAALALAQKKNRVYVMMSDGEQEEGSTWEAVMYAGKVRLPSLVAIIDKNQFQIDGATEEIMPSLDPLSDKYRAFGWNVLEIDGHSFSEIFDAFEQARSAEYPTAIVSNTVRGKGVSYMEGSEEWHAGKISDEQLKTAIKELS